MLLDYTMLRELGEYNRAQVAKAYASGRVHGSHKLPRRRWWVRLSHDRTRTETGASPQGMHATGGPTPQRPLTQSGTGTR
jgi:hypothetical protein